MNYEFSYDAASALVLLEPDNANLDENARQFFKIQWYNGSFSTPPPNRQGSLNLYMYIFSGRHDINKFALYCE